jgi:hypothetical protein
MEGGVLNASNSFNSMIEQEVIQEKGDEEQDIRGEEVL